MKRTTEQNVVVITAKDLEKGESKAIIPEMKGMRIVCWWMPPEMDEIYSMALVQNPDTILWHCVDFETSDND